MTITLSQDELRELTGYEVPAWQIKWLKEHGWVHEVSRKRPKVARFYFEQKMGFLPRPEEEQPLDFSCWAKEA